MIRSPYQSNPRSHPPESVFHPCSFPGFLRPREQVLVEMFKAAIGASTLQDALDSISVLVDECKFRLDDDQLGVRAVDPANVGMVDLTLSPGAFESYSADGGVIGLNLSRFEDIVSMANSGDIVHLELDEETRKLLINFNGLSYTLALIDPDSIREEPDIPDLDLPGHVWLMGEDLSRGVKAADMVSDHVRLRINEQTESFYIEAEGDTDDVDLELTSEELVDLDAGPADSLFSLDYLKDMKKPIASDAEVHVEVGEEFPTKLHYGFAEGEGEVTFMLAPRITSD